MKILYKTWGWVFIRPLRWFTHRIMCASFGPRLLPERNQLWPHYGPCFYAPNLHWWLLYKTFGKFSLWLHWDAWRVFCDWTGGYRRTYPWPARAVHLIGKTLSYPYNGGACYHCASEHGDPVELSDDDTGKYFKLTDSGTESTPDGTNHWFKGITTCPKCGYQQEYGDGSL
jgi:hypothetical protein